MPYPRKEFRKKKFFSLKLIFLILIIALIPSYYYISDLKNAVDENDNTIISFDVKSGQNLKDISQKLKENDLIKSKIYFEYYTKNQNLSEKIMAGRFSLSKSQDIKSLIEKLSSPPELSILTIQEGLTIQDIDEKLSSQKLISEGELIEEAKNFKGYSYYPYLEENHPLEGYLYPDTYFFDPTTFKAETMIYKSMDNFENKLKQVVPETEPLSVFEAIDNSGRSLNDIIIMASIIEKEVFGKTDRKIVSGILWKRLDSDWLLGADATLLYGKSNNIITKTDLETDSPYNTRKILGLPPTPISNPSLESILASLYPTKTDYWFYLNTQDTGETIYAKTNEEHNINRAKHL